jgi:hypothetical protein
MILFNGESMFEVCGQRGYELSPQLTRKAKEKASINPRPK